MELDYQMALLLQHKFEREHREKKNAELSDKLLAKLLQDDFERESSSAAAAGPSLIIPEDNKADKLLNSSKCLTDPSWELNDPTPDIHLLFVVFSKKFFWDQLGSVTVSWSKRMTTCAGICSYSGRGGMCVITLSEPLLKLRPRKDLVETLLHEMIHAFLFVTHNNRDRDGHGPEFHKHMSRINTEAGTKITVYHNFHEEVRLYKQHWWRCNGPCQHRGPFFGMVRRAMNRAPGRNDRWWDEHSRTCGGTFTKVREPEKNSKGNTPIPVKPVNTINNYFGSPNGQSSGSNIKTFKDLGGSSTKGRSNSSSTIVTTRDCPKDNTYKPTRINNVEPQNSTTKDSHATNATTQSQTTTNDFINVRSHWQNKFIDTAKPGPSSNSASKRPSEDACPRNSKVRKTASVPPDDNKEPNTADCPVCGKKVLVEKLNEHLDVCLEINVPSEELKTCEICKERVKTSEFDQHAEQCLLKMYDGVETEVDDVDVSCLACGKKIKRQDLNAHLDECMVNIFTDKKGDGAEAEKPEDDQFNCPFCMKLVDEIDMKGHIDGCLKSTNLDDFLE